MSFINPISALILIPVLSVASDNDWENPEVFSKGQSRPHTPLVPYQSLEDALLEDAEACNRFLSLDGDWSFRWVDSPESIPDGFEDPEFDVSTWDVIEVPSNWQMKGYGHAKFRNIPLSFPSDPPKVPDYYNPVGLYRKTIKIPLAWLQAKNPIYLRFEGVKSAAYVWVNGEKVGYNQGGMEPAEFEVSAFLVEGNNTIAVEVIRFSDGTYLENQDMWRLSGIHRSVSLFTVPDLHMQDYFVSTDFDENYLNAIFRLEITLQNHRDTAKKAQIRYRLMELGAEADSSEKPPFLESLSSLESIEGRGEKTLVFEKLALSPKQWSAETANLYRLSLELLDEDGSVLEVYAKNIGFRETEIGKDGAIYVNGRAIKFNGVNSHQHHPVTGKVIDEATMRRDFELMKQFNINLVRTSHYPPSVRYLELANEYGLYVVDETNDECHQNIYLSDDIQWKAQFVDRMSKMVYRDRNQPCIVFWSAGNETGRGQNMDAVILEGKRLDPSRPYWMCGENEYSLHSEDIAGPRYWEPVDLELMLNQPLEDDPRPIFMDEYLSVAGNSLGGMDENWALIRQYTRHTGGAIWDWVSPSLLQPLVYAVDRSKHENHGAIMGRAQVVDGRNGNGIFLSGNDEWIDFYRSRELDLTGPMTLECWVKPGVYLHSGDFVLKSMFQYGLIQTDASHVTFFIYDAEAEQRIMAQAQVPEDWVDEWHHLAGTFDGERLRLYIDGQQMADVAFKGRMMNVPFSVSMGHDSSSVLESYTGQTAVVALDDVRIYDKALTQKQIAREQPPIKPILDVGFDEIIDTGKSFYTTGGGRTYGLVWADRSIQPELWQAKKTPQPVKVESIDLETGQFEVKNYHHFRNLNEFDAVYYLIENGTVLEEHPLSLDLSAGASEIVSLPDLAAGWDGCFDRWIEFSFKTKENQLWAEKGHEIAWDQFQLTQAQGDKRTEKDESLQTALNNPLSVLEKGGVLSISGDGFQYQFNREQGTLHSVIVDGKTVLAGGPEFNVWRAPLANDQDGWSTYRFRHLQRKPGLGNGMDAHFRTWGIDDLQRELRSFEVVQISDSHVLVRVQATSYSRKGAGHNVKNTSSAFSQEYTYRIRSNGELSLEVSVNPDGPMPAWLPRVGLSWELNKQFQAVKWYGRGPFENYPDRASGAKISVYEKLVSEFYVPYLIPQDYGNRCDTRWVEILDDSGTGLRFSNKTPFNFSVHVFDRDHLDRAFWPFQLREGETVTLNTDVAVSGVGDSSASVMTQYRVRAKPYHFKFTITPLR